MAIVRNTIKFSSGGGSDITVVANYSALPDPTTVSGQFYWCSASQGTSWLPGSLGGTYYNSGMYYSNGTTWEFINVPYQATQLEVNTGANTNKFVTPSTFENANKWTSKQDVLTDVNFGEFMDVGMSTKLTPSGSDSLLARDSITNEAVEVTIGSITDNKVEKTTWTDYSATSTIVGWSSFTQRHIYYKIIDGYMFIDFYLEGTSNSTSITFTLPNNSAQGFSVFRPIGLSINNSVASASPGRVQIPNATNIVTILRDLSGSSVWTASGVKSVAGQISFKI